MSAIEDKNRQSAGKTESLAGKLINHPAAAGYSRRLNWTVLLSTITACIMLASGPTTASEFMVDVKSIAQIRVDDDNRAINYPVAIYLDPVEEELYLINGGKNRVVVYGPDYFPRTSIGIGRDVISPRGVTVMNNGEVYLGQVVTYKNPRPRITILNAAFFLEREIFLDEIPEIEKFRPRNSAMSYDGILYQTGDDFRGVLVFDNEGNFLRLLQPTDHITLRGKEAEAYTEQELLLSEEAQGMGPEEDLYADIPEEFRPVITQDTSREINGPVKVNYVTIDRSGKLYLLSAESGKIYVYGPDENFLFSFGTKGGSPGQMSNPRALVIDEEIGVIYVVDYMRHTILAYNMAGEYVFEVGGRGTGPMYFNFPNDLAINSRGQLIVADLFNNRVQVLELSKEGIFYYLNKLSEESLEDIADTIKSTEFGEPESLQPETGEDQENVPDASAEAPEGVVIVEDEENKAEEAPFVYPDGVVEEELAEDVQQSAAADTPTGQDDKQEILPAQPDQNGQAGSLPEQKQELPATNNTVDQQSSKHEEKISTTPFEPSIKPVPPVIASVDASEEITEPTIDSAVVPDITLVEPFVASWVENWEQKNIVTYLSHYSRNFITPDGMSMVAWEKNRYEFLENQKSIKIEIRDMQKKIINDSRIDLTFIQRYQSESYSDEVEKTLELVWEDDGWAIVKETSRELQ